jgi:hypothetical protein
MTSRASKIVAAAVLASSIPAIGLACDHERGDRDGDRRPPTYYAPPAEYPAPPTSYAPPAEYPASPTYYAPPAEYPAPPAPYRLRDGSWREREIAQVTAEIRELDARRAEARARLGWNRSPRKMWMMWRFERWYAARHAELERRLYELQYVAWR